MLKVYKLVTGDYDPLLIYKLIYLDRLVRFYSKFLKTWKTAGVYSDGINVRVRFMTVNKHNYESFTEREFTVDKLDERIQSYREKINREFSMRHDNPRIQRNKEIHKWKRYIDNAKIQM